MFYQRFTKLCALDGKKPSQVLVELGLSKGNLARWRDGASVNSDILVKLASYFNVSTDYLIGRDFMKSKTENEGFVEFVELASSHGLTQEDVLRIANLGWSGALIKGYSILDNSDHREDLVNWISRIMIDILPLAKNMSDEEITLEYVKRLPDPSKSQKLTHEGIREFLSGKESRSR